jgi:hypothetical protein
MRLSLCSTWEVRTKYLLGPIEPSAVEGVLIVSFNPEVRPVRGETFAEEIKSGDVVLVGAASGGESLAFGFCDEDEDPLLDENVELRRFKLRPVNCFVNESLSLA